MSIAFKQMKFFGRQLVCKTGQIYFAEYVTLPFYVLIVKGLSNLLELYLRRYRFCSLLPGSWVIDANQ